MDPTDVINGLNLDQFVDRYVMNGYVLAVNKTTISSTAIAESAGGFEWLVLVASEAPLLTVAATTGERGSILNYPRSTSSPSRAPSHFAKRNQNLTPALI